MMTMPYMAKILVSVHKATILRRNQNVQLEKLLFLADVKAEGSDPDPIKN
jgi:hypothetical protein